MENVERTIVIPDDFNKLSEDEQEIISNEMFEFLWEWKNKKHNKQISVNGVVYRLRKSPNSSGVYIFHTEEHRCIWGEQMFGPYERHICVGNFRIGRSTQKQHFHMLAKELCSCWSERVATANKLVEQWKTRKKIIDDFTNKEAA